MMVFAAWSSLACGSPTKQAAREQQGHGRINLYVLFDGTAGFGVTFEAPGTCPVPKSAGACAVEDTLAPLDCDGTGAVLPSAGTITVSGGAASVDSSPDKFGFYADTALQGLSIGAPLHVHAAGGDVPAFDADIAIPSAMFAFTSPTPNAAVTRSKALDVAWSATGTAPLSDVRLIGQDASGGSHSVLCRFPSTPEKGQIDAALLSDFADAPNSVSTLKPGMTATVRSASWEIEVLAEGAFDSAKITFVP